MPIEIAIPILHGTSRITMERGSSLLFVGANGGGKTRLAVHIETTLGLEAHRISAHRALALNPNVNKVSEKTALNYLRRGGTSRREISRWNSRSAVHLLNDFDYLIQALFAQQANKALETHSNARAGLNYVPEQTQLELLGTIWQHLFPGRLLDISGDDIKVTAPDSTIYYEASEMSDGERATFYLIGQTLVAAENSVLIIDEPELHVHRSIMSKLWDELEAARQDCAFVFITHDLEFAAARVGQKYIIHRYDPKPHWDIEAISENGWFNEEITTLILGSRRPILFVEGDENSLDQAVYRCCFPEWTVIPKSSCEEVIHSVATMRNSPELTRVTCAGIVDADDCRDDDVAKLNNLGVFVLPVSEIENVFLLPNVSRSIAESEGFEGEELDRCLERLEQAVFDMVSSETIEVVVMRYCRRRIDRMLKSLDVGESENLSDLIAEYHHKSTSFDIASIAEEARTRICDALQDRDLPKLLANYDNKGLLSLAAKHLRKSKLADFTSWLTRVLRSNKSPSIAEAIRSNLPEIHPG